MIYCLYTLVDITASGQYKSRNDLERLQQQNFDTVMQTIGLAGNVYFDHAPKPIPADIFGNKDQTCWYFEWTMEIEHLFEVDGDELSRLKDLFEYVPFIAILFLIINNKYNTTGTKASSGSHSNTILSNTQPQEKDANGNKRSSSTTSSATRACKRIRNTS